MDSFTLYRERIGETLTRRLAEAIGQEVVTVAQASEISEAILSGIDTTTNPTELMQFVEELANKWTIFDPILFSEKGQLSESQETNAVTQISDLLKDNKIEEAITTATRATQITSSESPPQNDQPQPTQEPNTKTPTPEMSSRSSDTTLLDQLDQNGGTD